MEGVIPKKISELRCSKCGSKQVRFRITTKEIVCNHCGNVEKVNGDLIFNG